jgi:hypothetical protein
MWPSENRLKYNRDELRYPSDLTDDTVRIHQQGARPMGVCTGVAPIRANAMRGFSTWFPLCRAPRPSEALHLIQQISELPPRERLSGGLFLGLRLGKPFHAPGFGRQACECGCCGRVAERLCDKTPKYVESLGQATRIRDAPDYLEINLMDLHPKSVFAATARRAEDKKIGASF